MFAAGCVLYYVGTGEHPFGERVEREINIINGKHFLLNTVPLERLMSVYKSTIQQNIERKVQRQQERLEQRKGSGEICSVTISKPMKTFLSKTSALYGENIDWVFTHLILELIVPDPKKRATASEALAHPFFWSPKKFLKFLTILSDRMEVLPRTDKAVAELEGDHFPSFEKPSVNSDAATRLTEYEYFLLSNLAC